MADQVGGNPSGAPQRIKDRAADLLITGQAILIDLGSPFEGNIGTLQMFLLQNENFIQSADIPDEPVANSKPAKRAERVQRKADRANIDINTRPSLQALRTHYKLKPFKLTLEGLLMPGETFEQSKTLTHYPSDKVNHLLQFMQGAHMLSYASTTTQQGQGTGFIKPLVISNFDWNKDDKGSNTAPFTLELQMVTTTAQAGGAGSGEPEDGGEKPPE